MRRSSCWATKPGWLSSKLCGKRVGYRTLGTLRLRWTGIRAPKRSLSLPFAIGTVRVFYRDHGYEPKGSDSRSFGPRRSPIRQPSQRSRSRFERSSKSTAIVSRWLSMGRAFWAAGVFGSNRGTNRCHRKLIEPSFDHSIVGVTDSYLSHIVCCLLFISLTDVTHRWSARWS